MFYRLGKKIFLVLVLMVFIVGNVSASDDHNLTDTQLHAFLGIITNFILSDVDSDGDGVYDSQDAFPHDATETVDTDGDGVGNNADTDDDGDGLSDVDENTHGTNPLLADTDGDGISDADEVTAGSDPLDPNSIAFGGVAYNVVTSPYTGHKWLDRNLGASQACTAYNDANCYGDYYQWGRDVDGHEDKNSATTDTQATSTYTTDDKFIKGHDDWVTGYDHTYPNQRATHWSQRDGSSVCPVGFRVPTIDELKVETLDNGVTNKNTAFANFLKLPSVGYRSLIDGNREDIGMFGAVWSSMTDGSASSYISFSDIASKSSNFRAYGLSVRCMKPMVTTDVPPIVTLHSSTHIEMIQFGSYPIINVTAVDDVDGILVPNTVATDAHGQSYSLIPTGTSGTYTVTFSITDSAGQVSNTVTMTVTVHPAMKKTGQTKIYDADGTDHTHAEADNNVSLRDDGYYQKGHDPIYERDDSYNIVSDKITGLEWQDDVAAKTVTKQWLTTVNYNDCDTNGNNCENTLGDTAASYCTALSLGGHEDWRLPSIDELMYIADRSKSSSPAIDTAYFENVVSNGYWSSSTVVGNEDEAWFVFFGKGTDDWGSKSYSFYVRCVRDGQ